jgi:hypothetical protein
MNRRTALTLPLLWGGLVPAQLWAQSQKKRSSNTREKTLEPSSSRDDPDASGVSDDEPNPPVNESGFQWKRYDISRYTRLASNQSTPPEKAIVDWIFKRTGITEWHGEKLAVLSASRTQLRAYNSPDVLKQVDEVVERFVNATDDVLSIHIQFIAAVDTRWRYTVFPRLTHVGSGPQGQQIWTMRVEDSAIVLSNMQLQQGFKKLADQKIEMINGQTLTIRTHEERSFAGGLQRESAAGLGFQPRVDKIDEHITLKMSPLLNFDGNAVDTMVDLTINTVRSFHRTKVLAPREIGPPEMSIDVPESTQTRLDQTIKNWPLGQTLLISGGIHPGILDKKSGWFNLPIPGTYPTGTEVLVFLDAQTVSRVARTARSSETKSRVDDRSRSRDDSRTRDDSRSRDDSRTRDDSRDDNSRARNDDNTPPND